MIATGRVKMKDGKVVEFETVEAMDTQHGSVKRWRTVAGSYTIGHPFRTTDTGPTFILMVQQVDPVPSTDPKERTKDNLQQEVVENIQTKKKEKKGP